MACGILTAGAAACKPDYTIAPQPATVSPGQTVRFSVCGAVKVSVGPQGEWKGRGLLTRPSSP